MRVLTLFAVLALSFILVGCYHAQIETGATPSNVTLEQNWASGFLYGLVPPSTVQTAERCPNGVARVETVHSFLNQLASALTAGLYTPMTIRVTCAAPDVALLPNFNVDVSIAADSSIDAIRNAFQTAGDLAVETGVDVLVQFE